MTERDLTGGTGAALRRLFDTTTRGLKPYLLLVALTLAVYLPGVLMLPPVDRTEVVFAETTRDMVERGRWLDPRYGDTVHQFRPIGTFWVQGLVAAVAGPEWARVITVYRLPSLLAVMLTVIAFFSLAAPRVGRHIALLAAGLFAVAPLTAIVSQLAIAEGLSLLPAVVAMLSLMRIYDWEGAPSQADESQLVWLFWISLGVGMAINALLIPVLVASVIVALAIMDRGDVRWLMRLKPWLGLPVALALGSPWLIVRAAQDGVPFAGMDRQEFIEALGGSQDMKLRAFPGTFLLAATIGFLPGVALIVPALRRLWSDRQHRLPKFLIAWIAGYLVYLELLSSKPGTYTVQAIFPAMALAVALLILDRKADAPLPKGHMIPWPPGAALFPLLVFGFVYAFTRTFPSALAAALIAAVAALHFVHARLGRDGDLVAWAVSGFGAIGLFTATLNGAVLPALDGLWPARQIGRTLAAQCQPASAGLLGFREPSGIFLLDADRALQTPEAIAKSDPPIQIVEARWRERHAKAMAEAGKAVPPPVLCIKAYNTMRGCALDYAVHAAPGVCRTSPAQPCAADRTPPPATIGKGCD